MVAAGSVVTRDVADHALVVGSPARQVGWVGRSGVRLEEIAPGRFACPASAEHYVLEDGKLRSLSPD